jgi:hypothetical protein
MRGFFVPEHKGTMDFGESFGVFSGNHGLFSFAGTKRLWIFGSPLVGFHAMETAWELRN